MARPRGAKPNGRRPRRAENENLAQLTSEVLRLRLQALNLPTTGSKAQMVKRLKAALQPQQVQAENPGRVRKRSKRKANTRVVRERRDKQPNPTNQPDERDPTRAGAVDEVDDDFSSVSSVEDSADPLDIDDPLAEVTLEETQPAPFTASQLATIRETVQRSLAEALQQSPPQPLHGLAVSPSLATPRRPGAATPLGLQHPVDKSTEDKILRGEYLDFTVLLPDSLNQSQVPELQVRFDDSGPGSSNMTMVRKRKPVIDTFHKWLDAYTTYMIVLVTAYPRRSLELLKYQQTISCAATKFKGLSWLTYDEQFRKRAAQDLTINWGQVDLELWTVTFSGLAKPHCPICSSPHHNQSDCPSADPSRQQTKSGPVCFRFNRASGCTTSSCHFPHVCRRCYSNSHSILNCPRSISRKDHSSQRYQGSSHGGSSKR